MSSKAVTSWKSAQQFFRQCRARRGEYRQYATKPRLPPTSKTTSNRSTGALDRVQQTPRAGSRFLSPRELREGYQPKRISRAPGTTQAVLWLLLGTVFVGTVTSYGIYIYRSLSSPDDLDEKAEDIDLTRVYDDTADHFDKDLDRIEYWWGTMALRSKLVKQARGHVLESAAGTGRNSSFYVQGRIKSLILADKSKGMLAVAEEKWPDDREGEDWTGKVQFIVGDVEKEVDAAEWMAGRGQFDTVVQSMGLCSTSDPEGLMRSLTQLVKPGGKILLLEHGQSYFGWLNKVLDHSAREHAKTHGCWWNRDIGAIVAGSGMEVLEMKRPWIQAGTTWYIVLQKPRDIRKQTFA